MNYTKLKTLDLFDDIFPSYFKSISNRPSLFLDAGLSSLTHLSSSDDSSYSYEFLIPGVDKSDISIRVESGVLIVESKKEFDESSRSRISKIFKNFKSTVRLPEMVDTDGIRAEYSAGILTVTIPKVTVKSNSREIKVS